MKVKFIIGLFLLLPGSIHFLYAQPEKQDKGAYYREQLNILYKAIRDSFYMPHAGFYKEQLEPGGNQKRYSYLWPLCALIQADNEMEKLGLPGDLMHETLGIIQHYYSPAAPAPGYDSYVVEDGGGDRFYDDNQWIGLAVMDAYDRTGNKSYVATGKLIYRFMMTGFDTLSGGGLHWKEGSLGGKNTCSNGPGILLALQLYKATKEKKYMDTALLLYHWVNDHLQSPEGLYYDNLNVRNGRIGRHFFSYNTGTMLEANVYLYELLHQQKYLQEAIRLANASSQYFLGDGKFRDGYWFSAVLLRGYQHLLLDHTDRKYVQMFEKCTDEALGQNRQSSGLLGKDHPVNLVNQGGMLEILARLAWIETKM